MARQDFLRGKLCGAMVAAAALIGVAGCGEHPLYGNASSVQIRMQPDSVQLSAIGRQLQLSAIANDASGRVVEPPLLYWTSDDPSIVQVDQSGTLTAVRDGTAKVSVLVGTVAKGSSVVRVQAGVVMAARISTVTNPLVNMATSRDSVRLSIHDPRLASSLAASSTP